MVLTLPITQVMSQQGVSRAPYRCRPCSERTGQFVPRAGHKCPPQEALVPSILPDEPQAIPPMPPTDGIPGFSSAGLNFFGLTDFGFPTPAISGVDFSMRLPLIQSLRWLITSQIHISLVVLL